MADTYEKDLAQKSSLTTSDFIRIVGSDNVSYKQLVTSVLALNGTFYDDAWKANADLNNIKANGVYWISSSPTNAPTGLTGFPLAVIARSDTVRQMIITGGNVIWTRTYQSSAWSAWVKQPTRAEVDAVKNASKVVLAKEITQSTSASVTLTAQHTYLVTGAHPFAAGCAYLVAGWASGAARITPILANSNLNLSLNSLTLTASLNANITMWIRVLDLGANS